MIIDENWIARLKSFGQVGLWGRCCGMFVLFVIVLWHLAWGMGWIHSLP